MQRGRGCAGGLKQSGSVKTNSTWNSIKTKLFLLEVDMSCEKCRPLYFLLGPLWSLKFWGTINNYCYLTGYLKGPACLQLGDRKRTDRYWQKLYKLSSRLSAFQVMVIYPNRNVLAVLGKWNWCADTRQGLKWRFWSPLNRWELKPRE